MKAFGSVWPCGDKHVPSKGCSKGQRLRCGPSAKKPHSLLSVSHAQLWGSKSGWAQAPGA